MAVDVSPWPAEPVGNAGPSAELVAARAALRELIKATLSDDRVDTLGATASALVERFAPSAPQVVRNEAALRAAAYMHAREPRAMQGVTTQTLTLTFARERFYNPNMLVNSGAASLLLPWRSRRALPIEEPAA